MSPHTCDKEKIRLTHLLISLAISHYFEEKIEEILNKAFGKLEGLIAEEHDLETISTMFEVFRLYGHKMSCDEDIMEEARSFTRTHLAAVTSTTHDPHLSTHMQNVLYIPRYHCVEIAVAREYISFYEQEEDHEEYMLKFAKLNFSYCQLHYIKELKYVTKWWKELELASKLPNTFRDRNVEIYFGMMELMARWDIGNIEDLPNYMQINFRTFWEVMQDIEREMSSLGRPGGVQPTIDEFDKERVSRDSKMGTRRLPSFEEYMEVGIVTGAMDDMAVYSFLGMKDCDEKIMYDLFASRPKVILAFNVVFRLINDITTFEEELERGEVANGVNCYMKQHGVSQEEAVIELKKIIKDR
ncbi:hypothetical protein Bca4012_067625 [Brassica carinata]